MRFAGETPGTAEGEGFEPSNDESAVNGFRDRRFQPLSHPSRGAPSIERVAPRGSACRVLSGHGRDPDRDDERRARLRDHAGARRGLRPDRARAQRVLERRGEHAHRLRRRGARLHARCCWTAATQAIDRLREAAPRAGRERRRRHALRLQRDRRRDERGRRVRHRRHASPAADPRKTKCTERDSVAFVGFACVPWSRRTSNTPAELRLLPTQRPVRNGI